MSSTESSVAYRKASLKAGVIVPSTCGWCGAVNQRQMTDVCSSCGGPLAPLPGDDPGPRPPEAPRQIPARYERRLLLTRNVFTILGLVFGVVGLAMLALVPVLNHATKLAILANGALFMLLAPGFLWTGWSRANKVLRALQRGTAARGTITKIAKDYSQRINHQNPWRVEYEFRTPAGMQPGNVWSWAPTTENRAAGQSVWVVYLPDRPEINTTWPPL